VKHRIREKAIFALLDGELDGKKRLELERHLAECDQCRLFRDQVKATQISLRDLTSTAPPPPVDWARIDAALEAGLEGQRQEQRSFWGGLAMWGTLATAATAAVALFWIFAPEEARQPTSHPSAVTESLNPTVDSGSNGTSAPAETAVAFDPFVLFVAGEALVSSPGEEWHPLGLESPLEEGTRVRTKARGTAGFQLASGHGCRLQPDSEVQITRLGAEQVEVDLQKGRIVCRSRESEPEVILSVIDVVAGATGNAHFAVERRPPTVVVVELAEGTLRVPAGENAQELSTPGTVEIRRGDERIASVEPVETPDAIELPDVRLMSRRTIASLQIPSADGFELVRVDGVDYGSLPLSLRHRPGSARIELMSSGAEPFTQEVVFGLGPRIVELSPQVTNEIDDSTPRPRERQIMPRIGTYTKAQQQRLGSLVARRVRKCYERTLKRDPSVWGRINVRLNVSTSGEAQRVVVNSLAGGHESINTCVRQGLSQERFPPPRGGYVPIQQTITLSPRF